MINELEDLGKVPVVYGSGSIRTWRVWNDGNIIGTVRRSYPSKAENPYNAQLSKGSAGNRHYTRTLAAAELFIRTFGIQPC